MTNKTSSVNELPHWFTQNVESRLHFLYGDTQVDQLMDRLINRLSSEQPKHSLINTETHWSEQDIILITYGDSIQQPDEKPLQTLYEFLSLHLKDSINSVHILPYFPYSSDDGFSVIDYKTVDPLLGNWTDIERIDSA